MSEQQEKHESVKAEQPRDRIQIRDVTNTTATQDAKGLVLQHSFFMEATLDDGSKVSGQFTCKRLTISDRASIGVMKARLAQEVSLMALDVDTQLYHEWLAHCIVGLTEKPTWFDPDKLYDVYPFQRAYAEVTQFQESFRKKDVG